MTLGEELPTPLLPREYEEEEKEIKKAVNRHSSSTLGSSTSSSSSSSSKDTVVVVVTSTQRRQEEAVIYRNPLDLTPLRPPAPARRVIRHVRERSQDSHHHAAADLPKGATSHPDLERLWLPIHSAHHNRWPSIINRHQHHRGDSASSNGTTSTSLRRVLERLWPSATETFAYAIDAVLAQHPKTGALVFLGTPMRSKSNDDPSSPLVTCGSPVVIKAVPRPTIRSKRPRSDNPLKEIAAMQHLQQHQPWHHPHIMRLLDCLQDQDYIYLILPYLSGGDLFARVKATDNNGLSTAEARSYLRQIIEGLLFMKETSGIAHHDISLENIMLTNHQQVVAQIIDLGMCLRVPKVVPESGETRTPVVYLSPQRCSGKPAYISPEVMREEACDPFAADVWSLGVCCYAMLTGRPLYSSPTDKAFKLMAQGQTREVLQAYEGYGLCLSPCAKDLVCRMLHADPTKRPTLEEVLHHPFVLGEELVTAADAPTL